MFLSPLRKPIDTFTPSLGRAYRSLRDLCVNRTAKLTEYGFSLAGDPRIASAKFESDEVGVFAEALAKHDVVIDIGANIGFYTCLAASCGKHVLAFEPSARNLNFLCKNVDQNGFSNVEIFPVGLANHHGLRRIYGYSDMASFVAGWAQADKSKYTLVPMTTLDTIIAGRFPGKRLLIKIDVEGFELDVLAGAVKTLQHDPKPTFLMEVLLCDGVIPGGVNQRYRDTFKVFWNSGYVCTTLGKECVPVTPKDVDEWISRGKADANNFMFSAVDHLNGRN